MFVRSAGSGNMSKVSRTDWSFPGYWDMVVKGNGRELADRFSSSRAVLLLDRRSYQVAPLGPRAVVVLHVFEAEQILQGEPGVAAALADAAVRDGRGRRRE